MAANAWASTWRRRSPSSATTCWASERALGGCGSGGDRREPAGFRPQARSRSRCSVAVSGAPVPGSAMPSAEPRSAAADRSIRPSSSCIDVPSAGALRPTEWWSCSAVISTSVRPLASASPWPMPSARRPTTSWSTSEASRSWALSTVGQLIGARTSLRTVGHSLVLRSPSAVALMVLEVCGLAGLIEQPSLPPTARHLQPLQLGGRSRATGRRADRGLRPDHGGLVRAAARPHPRAPRRGGCPRARCSPPVRGVRGGPRAVRGRHHADVGRHPRGSLCSCDAISARIEELQFELGEGPASMPTTSIGPSSNPTSPTRRSLGGSCSRDRRSRPASEPSSASPCRSGPRRLGALNLYRDELGP